MLKHCSDKITNTSGSKISVCKYFVDSYLNAGRNPLDPLYQGQASTPQITDFADWEIPTTGNQQFMR